MSGSTQVVVGYDGSPDSHAALQWAIREASSRGFGIRIVYCAPDLRAWDGSVVAMSGVPVLNADLPDESAGLISAALDLVTAADVPVETVSSKGSPAGVLVEQSKSAGMVVIGSRGHGAVASAILGSTVAHVASHAHSPVVVAQARGSADGPVVVGVDGSPHSEELVGWAIDHASRHGLALEVLHSYAIPVYPGVVPYVPPEEITEATREFEHRVTAEVLAGWRERYPDVGVTVSVLHGRPGPMLVEAADRASLTVVGSRGRGAFLGMLLGSTSQSLLQHARGSVAVLRYHKD